MSPAVAGPDSAEQGLRGELGFVHSEQACSAVDGPGLRTVFWLSGCVLRCQYCHNPDTWKLHSGRPMRPEQLVRKALRYRAFARRSGGGLTLTGGEPLVQHAFVSRVFALARASGVHTVLDTNGYFGSRLSDAQLDDIDLVLLDIKSIDRKTHLRLTGAEHDSVLAFARRLAARRRPVWVRFVLVPGVTDDPVHLAELGRFCAELGNVERFDVLPFHQLGREKWRKLGLDYPLAHAEAPSPRAVAAARAVVHAQGLQCGPQAQARVCIERPV
jgi:pyruvate formate lyase activating enzyme